MSKIKDFFIRMKWYFLVAAVCLAAGFGSGMIVGCHVFRCDPSIPDIEIKPGKPGKPGYTKPPPGNLACGPTINMKGAVSGKSFNVLAWDDCKYVTQSWALKLSFPQKRHTIAIGYGLPYNIDMKKFNHLVDGAYYYNLGPVGLGGGAVFIFDRDRLYDVGPRISIKATF